MPIEQEMTLEECVDELYSDHPWRKELEDLRRRVTELQAVVDRVVMGSAVAVNDPGWKTIRVEVDRDDWQALKDAASTENLEEANV